MINKKRNNIIFVSIVILALLFTLFIYSIWQEKNGESIVNEFDFPHFNDLDALVESSDDIVLCSKMVKVETKEIVIGETESGEKISHVYEIYEASIIKSLLNKKRLNDKISVKIFADKNGNDVRALLDKQCERYLLFVKVYDDVPASLLNLYQAIYGKGKDDEIFYTAQMKAYIDEKGNGFETEKILEMMQ